jgi:hypothetical protein
MLLRLAVEVICNIALPRKEDAIERILKAV